jgi:REP element-mobilizing transposase RayT
MVPHHRRTMHDRRCPAHVTLRATSALPSLRQSRVFAAVRGSLSAACRDGFRVVQFSVQRNHVHLLVEADSPARFTRGLQGLAIRVAKAVNRVLGRRGRVWGDRFHARLLRTPHEVRNALVYVLNNWRKHVPGAQGLDPRSSAGWFDGWMSAPNARPGSPPVASACTWLARIGWTRGGGRLRVDDTPRRS